MNYLDNPIVKQMLKNPYEVLFILSTENKDKTITITDPVRGVATLISPVMFMNSTDFHPVKNDHTKAIIPVVLIEPSSGVYWNWTFEVEQTKSPLEMVITSDSVNGSPRKTDITMQGEFFDTHPIISMFEKYIAPTS